MRTTTKGRGGKYAYVLHNQSYHQSRNDRFVSVVRRTSRSLSYIPYLITSTQQCVVAVMLLLLLPCIRLLHQLLVGVLVCLLLLRLQQLRLLLVLLLLRVRLRQRNSVPIICCVVQIRRELLLLLMVDRLWLVLGIACGRELLRLPALLLLLMQLLLLLRVVILLMVAVECG